MSKELIESALNYMSKTPVNEAINVSDFTVSFEKSQFGGFLPKVFKTMTGTVTYRGGDAWKSSDDAMKQANAYITAYAKLGDRGADSAVRRFRSDNVNKLYKK